MAAALDLVRSIHKEWERGDFSSSDWADPEIEFVIADGPEAGASWAGLTAMAGAWRDFLVAYADYSIEAQEYRELDGGRVLVLNRAHGRGKMSGVNVEQMRSSLTSVFHVRDGRVTRLVLYWDRERALADLGLAAGTPQA